MAEGLFLNGAVAAIDEHDLSADEVRGGRGEVEDQVGDFDRFAESTEGNPRFHGRALGLVAPGFCAMSVSTMVGAIALV